MKGSKGKNKVLSGFSTISINKKAKLNLTLFNRKSQTCFMLSGSTKGLLSSSPDSIRLINTNKNVKHEI